MENFFLSSGRVYIGHFFAFRSLKAQKGRMPEKPKNKVLRHCGFEGLQSRKYAKRI
jgi:hypothetical protein